MEKITRNQLNMVKASLTCCTNNADILSDVDAYAALRTSIDNKVILIEQLNQVGGSKGVTLDVALLRKTMCCIGLKIGNSLSGYAASIQNNDLRDRVTFTIWDLNKMSKQ